MRQDRRVMMGSSQPNPPRAPRVGGDGRDRSAHDAVKQAKVSTIDHRVHVNPFKLTIDMDGSKI